MGVKAPRGLVVGRVGPSGAAAAVGILPGDGVLAIDGLSPRDVIDVHIGAADGVRQVLVWRDGALIDLHLPDQGPEELGLEFIAPTADGIRRCANACAFCFIDGLPTGMRETLYVKDDDFRYSFLYGSFVTLASLSAADRQRICYQRLSPLRVSVHATDLMIRRRMLGNPRAPDILEQLDWFGAAGIQFHAQIVLVPGENDGPVLTQTIADLATRNPVVQSVAVVPVGLTRHSHTASIRTLRQDDAVAAVSEVERWQRRLRRSLGLGFVYASDELYLLADRQFPRASRYDGYPQLQNGVGLVPLFLGEWRRARRRLPQAVPSRHVIWVCGQSMERALSLVADDMRQTSGLTIEVVAVPNVFFGTGVTVSGLLTATDVIRTLEGRPAQRVVLPRAMFDAAGERTLDNYGLDDFVSQLSAAVRVAGTARELLEATCAA
jgi:putative radical SAM enzyme (TIGR03279 family)